MMLAVHFSVLTNLLKGYYIIQLVVHDKLDGRGSELGKHGIRVITL